MNKQMNKPLIGAFLSSDVWRAWTLDEAARNLEQYQSFGINAIVTESATYRADLIDLAHRLDMRWFGGAACFFDRPALDANPALWPINERGERCPPLEWYVGIMPTHEDYNAARLDLIEGLVREHDLDGFILDFIRWPIHWELELRPDASEPLQSSFDPHSLARFQAAADLALAAPLDDAATNARYILDNHRAAWVDFKCGVITDFVAEVSERVRVAKPDMTLGLYAVPVGPDIREATAGQRVPDLAPHVDLILPMAYHAIMHQPPEWVGAITAAFDTEAPGQVLPIIQVAGSEGAQAGEDWGPAISVDGWGQAVQSALDSPGGKNGLIAFTGDRLFEVGKGERLGKVLQGGR